MTGAFWDICDAVADERTRQDHKWGADSIVLRSAETGLRVLVEEVGEVAKEINERDKAKCRKELVQVAAVAVAMIEALDAGGELVRSDRHPQDELVDHVYDMMKRSAPARSIYAEIERLAVIGAICRVSLRPDLFEAFKWEAQQRWNVDPSPMHREFRINGVTVLRREA